MKQVGVKEKSETCPGERGVSPIIGVVLLIGIVALTSLSLFVVAVDFTSSTTQAVEQEQVEQSFIELSHSIETESKTTDSVSQVGLDAGDHGAITRDNSALMEVDSDNLKDPISAEVGTIEWENEAGTTVAYQAGSVFRDTGNQTQLLSSPSISYDRDTETLTMPAYNVSGDHTLNSGDVRIEKESSTSKNEVTELQQNSTTIRVESEYYLGWKEYFEEDAGGTVVSDYGSIDGDFGYVVAKLGYIDFDDEVFSEGITHSGECNIGTGGGPSGCDDDGIGPGDPSQPMDSVVDQMINKPEEANNQSFDYIVSEGEDIYDAAGQNQIEDDYVLIDRDLDDEELEVSLKDGNATVAIDGNMKETDVTVEDNHNDHTLQIYLNGSFHSHNNEVCVEDCVEDGTTIQIFGTSETGLYFHGPNSVFEGLFYAASDEDEWDHVGGCTDCSDHQFYGQQWPDVYGSIVVKSMHVDSQGTPHNDFERDPDIDDADIDFREDLMPPQLTYLNVAEHRMSVENS